MKICLYLEGLRFLGGFLYKNIGTGLLSSYKNQKNALEYFRIPYVEEWSEGCDIFQINTPWLKSLWLIKKAKRRGMKVIIWSHVTVEDFIQVFRFNKYIAPLMKKYLAYAYNQADLIFSPSEYTKSLVAAYGISKEKIVAFSNGVDLEKFYKDEKKRTDYREKYNLKNLAVGTVGLAIPRKGIDTFLKLAEKFPENKFMWYGKIYSSLLVKSLPKNIPANTRFTGYVDDILAAFNSLDIFIFPSYEENQGMVILEAAVLGLPILVRDIPVYGGWLVHGENCLKAKNDEEFEKNLKLVLADEGLREKLSKGALALAQKEDIKKSRLTEIYQQLVKTKRDII